MSKGLGRVIVHGNVLYEHWEWLVDGEKQGGMGRERANLHKEKGAGKYLR